MLQQLYSTTSQTWSHKELSPLYWSDGTVASQGTTENNNVNTHRVCRAGNSWKMSAGIEVKLLRSRLLPRGDGKGAGGEMDNAIEMRLQTGIPTGDVGRMETSPLVGGTGAIPGRADPIESHERFCRRSTNIVGYLCIA